MVPSLQLVVAVAAQLPDSTAVRAQAVAFVEAHRYALGRLMDEAADGRRCGP